MAPRRRRRGGNASVVGIDDRGGDAGREMPARRILDRLPQSGGLVDQEPGADRAGAKGI